MHVLIELNGQIERVLVALGDVELVSATVLQLVHRRLQRVGVVRRTVDTCSLALELTLVLVECLQTQCHESL